MPFCLTVLLGKPKSDISTHFKSSEQQLHREFSVTMAFDRLECFKVV